MWWHFLPPHFQEKISAKKAQKRWYNFLPPELRSGIKK
jgi:hypothetical protein